MNTHRHDELVLSFVELESEHVLGQLQDLQGAVLEDLQGSPVESADRDADGIAQSRDTR